MRSFKVKALSVSGLKGKVFESGDTVTEESFPRGACDDLVSGGYLEEITEEKKKEDPKVPTIDEVSEDFLKAELKKKEIKFKKDASKEDLYNLWISK